MAELRHGANATEHALGERVAVTKDIVQFRLDAVEPVLARMAQIAANNDGLTWLNVQPYVDAEDQPKVSLLRHIFSAKGQPVPTGTWVPGHTSGKQPTHTELGLQHGAGVGALSKLAAKGITAPEHWILIQEHTRRGVVYAVPRDEDPAPALDFMLRASVELSQIDTDDRWLAGFVTQS